MPEGIRPSDREIRAGSLRLFFRLILMEAINAQ